MYVYRAEKENKREKMTEETTATARETTKEIRKKEKNCEIDVFGRKSVIQYFYRRWILNISGLSLRPGILFFGCNLMILLCKLEVRIYIFILSLTTVI